ncbi:MAG: M23 family metallopeptidase [Porphyromonadaceae bacterium]|nr:M23 family metallopeptidase [Porphyromonadaceae bacterium]
MAKKTKYHFNKETLSFEEIEITFLKVLKYIGIYAITGIATGVIAFFIISYFFSSPMEKSLRKENEEMKNRYKFIEKQIREMNEVISDLRLRDNNLYRVIFQTDPLEINEDNNIRYYENLSDMSNTKLMNYITLKTNDLAKSVYLQSKSYDEIVMLAKQNEDRLQNLPAIQPVMNKDLRRLASGFGYRIDPIYHVKRFHAGMDFAAPTGTDIYATGNGKVSFAGWKQGFGLCVIINHGFNYETLYAHQSKLLVQQGQSVKRGEVIGLVGNTGKSTAPHLHYEVHFKGRPQDPRNYYILDLTPEQYDEMIRLSESSGNILD